MTRLRSFFTKHGPLLLGIVMAAGLVVVSEYSNWRADRAWSQTQYSLEIRRTLSSLWRQVLEAETGHRGYLITGKDDYASPYYGAISAVNQTLQKLHALYESGGRRTTEFDALSLLVQRKMAELAATYQLRANGSEAEWRNAIETDIGRDLMVLVNNSILGMLDTEQRQLAVAQASIAEALFLGRTGIALVTMLALLAFALYLRQSSRLNEARRQQEVALQRERDQLEATANLRARQLARLASYLVSAREDERARIARELHDELGALFTTAKLDVARLRLRLTSMTPEIAERLQHLTETINTGVTLKRQIIEDLRPSSLSNLGLVAALENLVHEFSGRTELKITSAFESVRLPPSHELTVYRFVQEAFTNIGKHAEAKNVSVELHSEGGEVVVRVRDDGKGFDPSAVPSTSHGLFGMRFRIEEAHGRLTIDSAPGAGTCIEAALPEQSV